MDLRSRLRSIVRPEARPVRRELTYEPDTGGYEASIEPGRVGEILGGRPIETAYGSCLVIDRRYESDRRHGDVLIADCELGDLDVLRVLDPTLRRSCRDDEAPEAADGEAPFRAAARTVFIDLETTGLSGGAGTVAFLVGCGFFDLGAFQVRQFLLTSYRAERALLAAVSEFFGDADLVVSYNGKTFDVPVMETRWLFHRMELPLEGVPHFDTLHAARRLWKARAEAEAARDGGCRLSTLERALFDVRRVGDVPGVEIPSRFFHFLRSGDPRPLEPVLEHNRLDLVSLAAVTARAARLVDDGVDGCPDCAQALALGRVYERAGAIERAEACYRRAASSECSAVRAEAVYRLGLRLRRERRFSEASEAWRALIELTETGSFRRSTEGSALRQFAIEALAIHHEHRGRDLHAARELSLFALEDGAALLDDRRTGGYRHRLARLDRKLAKKENAQLFRS
jgi:uncharacterized protein YprB with RNaseH-like and TPR domain